VAGNAAGYALERGSRAASRHAGQNDLAFGGRRGKTGCGRLDPFQQWGNYPGAIVQAAPMPDQPNIESKIHGNVLARETS